MKDIVVFLGLFGLAAAAIDTFQFNTVSQLKSFRYEPSQIDPSSFPKDLKITPRIVGGRPAKLAQFPFQVAIFSYMGPMEIMLCGGSLISPEYVLTAAHCLDSVKKVDVIIGTNNVVDISPVATQQALKKNSFTIHKDWNNEAAKNDIALIKLSTPVKYSRTVQPIRLPSKKLAAENFENEELIASGWGIFSDTLELTSDYLRYVFLDMISQEECKKYYPNMIWPSSFCADGSKKKSTCGGDSGGPLTVQDKDGNPTLVGITSFGLSYCEAGAPSVFTRVASFLDWISTHTEIEVDQ